MKEPKKRTINELRQTKDCNYTHPEIKLLKKENYESIREKAELFVDENYFHLKIDLGMSNYNDVISAIVDFKKQTK
tara:strand:- start:701 stop:928 length:228 start_codon:yes stop_codon:yes gene_type:complete